MSGLDCLPSTLMRALLADPARALAQAAAWLDPVHFTPADTVEDVYWNGYDEDPEAALLYALGVCRHLFPAVYAAAIEAMRQGAGFAQLERLVCAGIREAHPPIDLACLADMRYGIPVEWYGLDHGAPELVEQRPDLVAILRDFGLRERDEVGFVCFDPDEVFEALPVARLLSQSLAREERQPCADLALLLVWLFADSGNSLVDCSYEMWAEGGFEPLEWERETLALVEEVAAQAEAIVQGAERGLERLLEDETWRAALRSNIAAARQALEGGSDHAAIDWPRGPRPRGAQDGAGGRASADPVVLLVRSLAAPQD